MAKPLRSQLNQIRAWVRQGRTDAWIAHQLEVSTNELREFRRRHELDSEEESQTDEIDLRDEIEAEIEAATREEEEAAAAADDSDEDEAEGEGEEGSTDEDAGDDEEARPRRRRRRRGGRGRGRARSGESDGAGESDDSKAGDAKTLQGTFDHGDTDGYGLWLDPSVADDPVYKRNWAGKRRVEVTIEADRIVIKRSK